MRWPIRVDDKGLVTRLSVGCPQCELGHTDREVSWQVGAQNLSVFTVWCCGGGLAASAHKWLYFLAGKRTPAALQEASREEPETPQGEPALVSVMNLQDEPGLQEGRVTGPVPVPEVS